MGRKKEIVHVRYRKLKSGEKSIYFEVSKNGNRTYLYQKERLRSENCEADVLHNNEVRLMIEERRRKLAAELILDQGEMEDHSLSNDITLVEWMDHHYEKVMQTATKSYTHNFKFIRKRIEAFRPGILLRDVDEEFIVGLHSFLRDYPLANGSSKALAISAVHFYIKIISAHLNAAIRERLIYLNPCTSLLAVLHKTVAHRTHIHALSVKELLRLIDTPCQREDVKRFYLFACFTGIKKKEILSLQWKHISRKNGQTWVTLYIERASKSIEIPLTDMAKACLPHRKRAKGSELVFTPRTPCYFKRHLSSWKEKAGIHSDLLFQVARDTYASLLLSVDTDFYTASYMMGFSYMTNMYEYEGLLNNKRYDVVRRMDAVLADVIHQPAPKTDDGR